jgi:hypothetical protein
MSSGNSIAYARILPGHAATPPRSVMNSRVARTEAEDHADQGRRLVSRTGLRITTTSNRLCVLADIGIGAPKNVKAPGEVVTQGLAAPVRPTRDIRVEATTTMTRKPQAGSDWEVILTQAAGGHHRGEQPPSARGRGVL